MSEFDNLQFRVGTWGAKTFPDATDQEIYTHLKRELKELGRTVTNEELCEEIADCVLLLMHLAHRHGISIDDEVRKKFAICKTRKWGPRDAEGVREHVREKQSNR